MTSDRIFGLVILAVALGFIASATQIQTSLLADPIGPRTFPMLVGGISAICALYMILRPDPEPGWPAWHTFLKLGAALAVLVGYAYTLIPLGFLIPTAIASGLLSYQIQPRAGQAALAGVGLSVGLFVIFKYALGLGLFAFPRALTG
ncbi:MAG: tripartite tricarboxylate transporter TctB family protein [Pseudomonadota bacterium]